MIKYTSFILRCTLTGFLPYGLLTFKSYQQQACIPVGYVHRVCWGGYCPSATGLLALVASIFARRPVPEPPSPPPRSRPS